MGRYWWGLGAMLAAGCMTAGPPERLGGPTPDRRYINPGTMAGLDGFTHAVKVGTTVYVSGEVALDSLGHLVGPGDLKAQAASARRLATPKYHEDVSSRQSRAAAANIRATSSGRRRTERASLSQTGMGRA